MRFLDIFVKKPKLAKRQDFHKMESIFTDSNKKRYYKYINDYDIPIQRMNHLQRHIIELGNGLDRNELKMFIEAFKGEINKQPIAFDKIGFLINELELRQDTLVHEDIMFGMVGCLYIREDQNPNIWDEETEQQKIRQFKKDNTKLSDFFLQAGLGTYIPYLKDMKGTLAEQLEQTNKKREAMMKFFEKNFGIDQKLLNTLEAKLTNA
jgi:hypothetical protein